MSVGPRGRPGALAVMGGGTHITAETTYRRLRARHEDGPGGTPIPTGQGARRRRLSWPADLDAYCKRRMVVLDISWQTKKPSQPASSASSASSASWASSASRWG